MRVNLDKTMRMSELPDYAKDLLYKCRLYYDKDVPKEEYLSHYHIIVIDGIIYIDDDDHANRLLKNALSEKLSLRVLMISCAVIIDKHVIKNRYGKDMA
jgi:hypothetical protein